MIVLITNIPTPYRIPLFNLIGRRLRKWGIEFHVLFAMDTYNRRKWTNVLADAEFGYTVLNLQKVQIGYENAIVLSRDLSRTLDGLKATCLIVGGFGTLAIRGV